MSRKTKIRILIGLTILTGIGTCFLPRIGQSVAYHDFADKRMIGGIPNFFNVVSNIAFLITGWLGLRLVWTSHVGGGFRSIYTVLFLGVLLTAVGSAYYHWSPNNSRLVFDRIPMTLVFMALLSATTGEVVDQRAGTLLLWPLVLLGIGSVCWWHWTEEKGLGDLRLYGLVQFYPAVFIPVIIMLFYNSGLKRSVRYFVWVVLWYGVAKGFEVEDYSIYGWIGVSGHTLKHLAAAASTWYFLPLFRSKHGSAQQRA